ncbi:MAG: DsbA family oxidoreductase [Muribaculaceae bacterium]|nr:DsbA family oxidoreductase [Muribaculaceae bacterium]
MKILVWSDFQCPFCYMGEKMLENVLSSMELSEPVEIEYKSYQLDPLAPRVPVESMTEHFMSGHDMDVAAAEARMEQITHMASKVGLKYNLPGVKVCNTMDAHRLMKFGAQRLSPGKLKKLNFNLFKANFEDNLLLSDHNVLAEIAVTVGLEREEVRRMLQTDAYVKAVCHDQDEIDARTDFEFVPYMLLDNGSVLQGVMKEPELSEWLKDSMANKESSESFTTTREGCGPKGCAI